MPARGISFSPLFIGEYSATKNADPGAAASAGLFQSPLHRGILCNASPVLSSLKRGSYFQSPLHRGILCNAHAGLQPGRDPCLSVPSSSGNTLQRFSPHAVRIKKNPFSPLFIGEYSATDAPRRDAPSARGLSVPSSSGNTLQLPPRNREKYLRSSFSPLFIGEYSATAPSG